MIVLGLMLCTGINFMIKLSRSGWNNVIIFAVMGFILIINATHDDVFSSKKAPLSEQQVLGSNAVLPTLNINQELMVERVGKNWRSTPNRVKGQALTQMMRSWQQLEGQVANAPNNADLKLALVVIIETADTSQPTRLHLLATDTELLVFNDLSQQWFSLPLALYSQLLPDAVFTE